MAKKVYYWIRKGGKFGKDVRFGDEIPADLPETRIKELEAAGYISDTKPVSAEQSSAEAMIKVKKANLDLMADNEALKKKNEFLEASNQEFKAENQDLKNDLAKLKNSSTENDELKTRVAELEAELEDFPKNVRAANDEIKKLKAEIDDLTGPSDKKGGK